MGMLTRDVMIRGLSQYGPEARVTDVMRRDLPLTTPHEMLEQAFQRMVLADCRATAVVDSFGRLVGMLTVENIGEMMMVHAAMSRRA